MIDIIMADTKTTENESYNVQIWLGLKNIENNTECSFSDVEDIIQSYVDKVGECVSVTPTKFIYSKGKENGVVIGFINYPRFPKEKEEILDRAWILAELLLYSIEQCRVSITTPEKTFMLTNEIKVPK